MRRRIIQFKTLLVVLSLSMVIGWADQEGYQMDRTEREPAASAAEVRPLLIGAGVPDLTLRTVKGELFNLNAAIARKPTILIFYRGGW